VRFPIGDFTCRLLTHRGALVEHDEREVVAILPPAIASALEMAEYQRFSFDPRAAASSAQVIDYDSPVVDRFERLVEDLGRFAFVPALSLPLKSIDPETVITGGISLTNGIIRDCRAESTCARYVGFFVQHELLADERVSGMTEVWVNATTRSAPQLDGLTQTMLASRADGESETHARVVPRDVARTVADVWALAASLARNAVEHRLQDTFDSLRRRRERDFMRLRDYYETIDGEIRRRALRVSVKGDDAAASAEASRLEATARAYRDRVADLVDRYRARVRVRPLAALVCTLPVHHLTARFHRRTESRTVAFTWNPIDRAIEPPCCEACGIGTSTVVLCDDRVHLLCPACNGRCASCGRPYCRACHAQCPRRHEAGAAASRPAEKIPSVK
jgi:hypothetical protein